MSEVLREQCSCSHYPSKNIAISSVCPCGKSISDCDCATCSKCGQLLKPKNNQQKLCPKCAVIVLEVL